MPTSRNVTTSPTSAATYRCQKLNRPLVQKPRVIGMKPRALGHDATRTLGKRGGAGTGREEHARVERVHHVAAAAPAREEGADDRREDRETADRERKEP